MRTLCNLLLPTGRHSQISSTIWSMDSFLWLFGLFSMVFQSAAAWCSTYLRPSGSDGMGIGVYAGIEWEPGDVLEVGIGVPIPMSAVYWTELVNYIEGYNSSHALLTLGTSMLYNHVKNPDYEVARKFMTREEGLWTFRAPFEHSIDVKFVAKRFTHIHEELFTHYGNDWFADRGLEELDHEFIDVTDHEKIVPGCVSDHTTIENNKLVAAKDIMAGETIEIVRTILIPEWAIVADSPLTDLLWWKPRSTASCDAELQCIDTLSSNLVRRRELRPSLGSPYHPAPWNRSTASYAVVLTGRGALYAHSTELGTTGDSDMVREANVRYAWWDAGNLEPQCDLLMMVSFTAIRDIAEGEELAVDIALDAGTHMRHVQPEFAEKCL